MRETQLWLTPNSSATSCCGLPSALAFPASKASFFDVFGVNMCFFCPPFLDSFGDDDLPALLGFCFFFAAVGSGGLPKAEAGPARCCFFFRPMNLLRPLLPDPPDLRSAAIISEVRPRIANNLIDQRERGLG